jgi:hypothetical protein
MADSSTPELNQLALAGSADTPSGLPMRPPIDATQEFIQDTVATALADVMTNPSNPLGQMVHAQAAEAAEQARGMAVGFWNGLTIPTPGRSPTYYYVCAGGMTGAAALNYYAAWKLPEDQMMLRIVSFLQGTAFVAAAAVNVQKAQRARS